MTKKLFALLALALLLASPARADNYETVPNPTAVWDTSTGVLYAIGTPGNTAKTVIPTLGISNTWTGTNTFSGTLNISGTFKLAGTSVTSTAAQLNFLNGATGTTGTTSTNLVYSTSPTILTAVLTTPAVNNPVITGPAPVACGATCSPTTGQLILLNQAGGSTATIPTSSGSGDVIRFRITVATTSAQEKILLATTTDAIIGTAIGENGGTAKVFVGNAGTYHSIQMPFTGNVPSGGFIGDQITCTDIATGTWACDINYQAGTTPTTPYSASTT